MTFACTGWALGELRGFGEGVVAHILRECRKWGGESGKVRLTTPSNGIGNLPRH